MSQPVQSVVEPNQSAKFWDNIAERYSKRPISDEAAYQHKLRVTREYLEPDMEVLEVGCGTGSTAIAHAPFVKHVRAIDISSKMIEIAQGKAAAESVENVTFERAALDEFGAADQTLDAVLALSVLHLLESKEKAIAKIYGYIRDSQQTTRCFRTRNAVVTVPARPNVSMENSGDFCTSASTGSSPWRVRAGLRMDSPWTSPQAATVCTEQGQPQRAGNPL